LTITKGYTTLALLRSELGSYAASDTTDDSKLEAAVMAASRQIDAHTGRFFWQDATVVSRQFYAEEDDCCTVDDISTATGLVVKTDSGDNGGFATTLTITTNFILTPPNAALGYPVRPWTGIQLVDGTTFPRSESKRPGVQVTAKFGWPVVPDDVAKACLIQSVQLFKASDAVFGAIQLGDGFATRVRASLNPLAEALLEPYCHPRVG
jgi:hypothetical protein